MAKKLSFFLALIERHLGKITTRSYCFYAQEVILSFMKMAHLATVAHHPAKNIVEMHTIIPFFNETVDYVPEDDIPVGTLNENEISDVSTQEVESQITGDETLARKLQSQFDNDLSVELLTNKSMDDMEVMGPCQKSFCPMQLKKWARLCSLMVYQSTPCITFRMAIFDHVVN